MSLSKPRLYYMADPLCGWSYGFAPILERLRQAYSAQVEWVYLAGGMAVGEQAKPMAEVAAHIRASLEPVSGRTGAIFGRAFYEDLLNQAEEMYDSTLPSAAMVYLKHRHPKADWPGFLLALQRGFFLDGLSPSDPALYEQAARAIHVNDEHLFAGMACEGNLVETQAEFDLVRSMDITGFPALVLEQTNGKRHPVVQGYATFERVSSLLERLLAMRLALD